MKPKYDDYMPEMLKMRENYKTYAEIAIFLNEKDENLNATESAVIGAIKRYNDKKDEKEQADTTKTTTVPENQEGIQKKEKKKKTENAVPKKEKEQAELFPARAKETIEKIFVLCEEMEENHSKQKETAILMEENSSKQKETAVLMEENYSRQKETAVLYGKSLENLAKLEAKHEDSIEKYSILNGTLQETIIQNKEKRRNRSIPYLIIGGFILTMALAMVVGYNSRRYNNPMSLHYLVVASYILCGVVAGIGIGIIKKKITAMLEKKKLKSES